MNVLLWTLGLCGLLLLVECVARLWIYRYGAYYVLPPGLRIRLRPDPEAFPQLEPAIRFDVNAAGERGPEVPRSIRSLCRILVAGGSQPEGYLLDQDTTWPGALQRILEQPANAAALGATRVHVGSIARSGVGSEALDLILERVLYRYPQLHTIIILVGASDVLRWLELGAPPSAPPPVRTSDVFRCHPEMSFGWSLNGLALLELLRRLRQRWVRPIQRHDGTCKWIGRARAMFARAKELRTVTPNPSPMLGHFDYHLRRAIQRAKAHADRVLVVRQPWFDKHCTPEEAALMWHGGVGQAWREEVTTFYSLDVLSSLMKVLDARAARIAEECGVEQLDLMPILEPSSKTYYDFFHATPLGARLIADAVASAVLRRPMPAPLQVPTSSIDVEEPFEFRQKVS